MYELVDSFSLILAGLVPESAVRGVGKQCTCVLGGRLAAGLG